MVDWNSFCPGNDVGKIYVFLQRFSATFLSSRLCEESKQLLKYHEIVGVATVAVNVSSFKCNLHLCCEKLDLSSSNQFQLLQVNSNVLLRSCTLVAYIWYLSPNIFFSLKVPFIIVNRQSHEQQHDWKTYVAVNSSSAARRRGDLPETTTTRTWENRWDSEVIPRWTVSLIKIVKQETGSIFASCWFEYMDNSDPPGHSLRTKNFLCHACCNGFDRKWVRRKGCRKSKRVIDYKTGCQSDDISWKNSVIFQVWLKIIFLSYKELFRPWKGTRRNILESKWSEKYEFFHTYIWSKLMGSLEL